MSDFPDYIYAFEAERFEAGPVRVIADDIPGYDGKYIEYIRADLVPQWKPIESVPLNMPVLAVVRHQPEHGRVAIVGSSNPDSLKMYYSYWMPIPKVPE